VIRVLIADDHAVVRHGVRRILSEEQEIVIAGEAENEEETLRFTASLDPDVVVLDITMPGRGGLDVLRDLKVRHPKVAVLVLSVHPERVYALRALKGGAAGYLTKKGPLTELVTAVKTAANGERYITKEVADVLAKHAIEEEGPRHSLLSDREHQIMLMIAEGRSPAEMAKLLSLSIKTISTYRTRILKKLDLKGNVEIAKYVLKNRLAEEH
jgi:DNA-binding NarL/FixJ family response regulator